MDNIKCKACGTRQGLSIIDKSDKIVVIKCGMCTHTFVTSPDKIKEIETISFDGSGTVSQTWIDTEKKQMPRAPLGYEYPCSNHLEYVAEWTCESCDVLYCEMCTETKKYGTTTIHSCPKCKRHLTKVTFRKPVLPFWFQLSEIALFPFQKQSLPNFLVLPGMFLVLLVIQMFFAIAAILIKPLIVLFFMLNLFLKLLAFIVVLFGITHLLYTMRAVGKGSTRVPDLGASIEGFGDVFRSLACLASGVLYFVPFVLYMRYRVDLGLQNLPLYFDPMAILLILAGFIPIPMIMIIAGVHDTVTALLNPLAVFRAIAEVPKEYCILYGLMAVILILETAVLKLTGYIPYVGQYLGYLSFYYICVVTGVLTGHFVYQCNDRLGWEF